MGPTLAIFKIEKKNAIPEFVLPEGVLTKLSGVIPNCSTVTLEKSKDDLTVAGVQRLGAVSSTRF